MDPPSPLVNPQEQAREALLATIAAAQRNPNGKDVVEYLTKLLGEMEGIGPVTGGPTQRDETHPEVRADEVVKINERMDDPTIATPCGDMISSSPITHLWEMSPEAAAKKRRELDSIWDALEREEEAWLQKDSGNSTSATENSIRRDSQAPMTSTAGQAPLPPAIRSDSNPATSSSKPKKGVKFVDGTAPVPLEQTATASSWGDVVPATLQGRTKPVPRATPIMKFEIVERMPSAASARAQHRASTPADSDDEEEGEDSNRESEDEDSNTGIDHNRDLDSDESESENASSDDQEALLRAASHARRNALLQQARSPGLPPRVRASAQIEPSQQMFVPIDSSIAIDSTSAVDGHRLPPSIPITAIGPDATAVIHEGKLVGDKLVVPVDSESDDDGIGEAGKNVIAMLRKRGSDSETPADGPSRYPLNSSPPTAKVEPAKGKSILRGIQERVPSMSSSATAVPPSKPTPTRVSRFKAMQQRNGPGPQFGDSSSSIPSDPSDAPTRSQPPIASARVPSVVVSSPSGETAAETLTIVDSPSFPSASSERRSPRLFDADAIMSRDVLEGGQTKKSVPPTTVSPNATPRVSRFKAERM
ncbi:hypothetical protein FRB95_002767 [Tulasnella sp. JGI-2019a]|nr:hypothetical protein FRB95_002767 [Tulasnella sp. JGI-2019a]